MSVGSPICGPYEGEIAAAYDDAELRKWLADLPVQLQAAQESISGHAGAVLHAASAPCRGRMLPLVIKAQGPLPLLKSWSARQIGTAAKRAWRVARHLAAHAVGTPEPVAWLERWEGGSCRESYFINRQLAPVTNFRDELGRLFRHDADAGRIVALLTDVAHAVRAMHDAGVMHNDLGNQNILLQRQTDGSVSVFFVDLNRARVTASTPSAKRRARDFRKLYLPTHLLRVFSQIYWNARPPAEFTSAMGLARRLYSWHERTRSIRHPFREARVRRRERGREPFYPPPRDIWIWDEKTAQPLNAWDSRERNWLQPLGNHVLVLRETVRSIVPTWKYYRELRASAFSQPVALAGRWGISAEPRAESWEREKALLPIQPGLPVLIRVYRHKGVAQWDFAVDAGRELSSAGYSVAFALCQDRRALVEPASWAAMCRHAIPRVAPFADWIEVGHAINRVKWGLWRVADYKNLVAPLIELKSEFPGIRLMGPAGIDFEYHLVIAALATLPRDFRFDALSHHLYVDRRGAPENRQAGFASVDKFALARAVARMSMHCSDRLIISEVNWPLAGTGIYSPVSATYNYPGHVVPANRSEHDYARFMLRYLLQAACSGMADRVYWWRLAAHGYGLVDDLAEPWRARPAYRAWLRLLEVLGDAIFERNLPAGDGAYLHLFRRPDGERVAVGYAWRTPAAVEWPFACRHTEDAEGHLLATTPPHVGEDPIYFRGVSL